MLNKRGCCVAMLEEPSSHRGSCHLPVLQQSIPLALPHWEMRHQPAMPPSAGEKLILKVSKLHSFLLRAVAPEALLFPVPQMKARIVGGCRHSALPGGRFRCSASETPTLSHCSETLLSSSQGIALLAVARIQQWGTEQLC